ncbi:hypothetical protein ACQ4PT_019856 [Festuca glaucescens]
MATSPIDAGFAVAPQCPRLPDDIVLNIFERLPAKSVGRCRCLSHNWAAALSSDDFADHHRRLANRRDSPRVFFLHHSFQDGPLMHVWSQDSPSGASSRMDVPRATNGNTIGSTDEVPQTINGNVLRLATLQCRGLVILQKSGTDVNYLCNPSTGKMAALPQGQKEGQKTWYENVIQQQYASLGLGYDVHTKTHNVVRIHYGGCDREGLPRSVECQVSVINSTGRWRPIQEKPSAWVRYDEPSVFAQGHVYWLAHRKVNISANRPVEMAIVSFSLADHTFGTVAPPLGLESKSLSKHNLGELDGHLCLFNHNVSQLSCYDIWLLHEHGANVWNLRCRIDMSKVSPDITDRFVRCRLYPLAIINSGNRILLVQPRIAFANNYSRLCAYDPVACDVEDIYSGSNMVYHCVMSSIDAAVYEESIISFG